MDLGAAGWWRLVSICLTMLTLRTLLGTHWLPNSDTRVLSADSMRGGVEGRASNPGREDGKKKESLGGVDDEVPHAAATAFGAGGLFVSRPTSGEPVRAVVGASLLACEVMERASHRGCEAQRQWTP